MSVEPVDLHFKEYGKGPPLLILHGLLGSGANWHTLSRRVFAPEFTVYAVDLRNHGRSPHSDRFDYPSMVADVASFVGRQGLTSIRILGHSMGGKVAMNFALENPSLVDHLVIVDIAPRSYRGTHENLLEALRAVDLSTVDSRGAADEQLASGISSRGVRQFLLKNLIFDSDTQQYEWLVNLDTIIEQYDRINEGVGNTWTFEGPTLFVRGENSDYVRDEDLEDILHLFPAARLETVRDAGHWVHADNPEAFGRLVLDFLLE